MPYFMHWENWQLELINLSFSFNAWVLAVFIDQGCHYHKPDCICTTRIVSLSPSWWRSPPFFANESHLWHFLHKIKVTSLELNVCSGKYPFSIMNFFMLSGNSQPISHEFNLRLQAETVLIWDIYSVVKAFQHKLTCLPYQLMINYFTHFCCCEKFNKRARPVYLGNSLLKTQLHNSVATISIAFFFLIYMKAQKR